MLSICDGLNIERQSKMLAEWWGTCFRRSTQSHLSHQLFSTPKKHWILSVLFHCCVFLYSSKQHGWDVWKKRMSPAETLKHRPWCFTLSACRRCWSSTYTSLGAALCGYENTTVYYCGIQIYRASLLICKIILESTAWTTVQINPQLKLSFTWLYLA